jgi:hypothetical protein
MDPSFVEKGPYLSYPGPYAPIARPLSDGLGSKFAAARDVISLPAAQGGSSGDTLALR